MSIRPASARTIYKVTTTVEVLGRCFEHTIGVAYPHDDGEGLNVYLFSKPFGEELRLRAQGLRVSTLGWSPQRWHQPPPGRLAA